INNQNSSMFEAEFSTTSLSGSYKKHEGNSEKNISHNRANKSHTTFFFDNDPANNEITYCKICKQNLDDADFQELIHECEPGTTTLINFTTDLWMAKSNYRYIGVIVTWLTSNYDFYEVLLTCNNLDYLHMGQIISDELYQIIHQWDLNNKIFTVATDNGANMIKSISNLNKRLPNIKRQPCAIHTLQLFVYEGLKQYKNVHQRIKSLQHFFRSPKQAQRLREVQNKDIANKNNKTVNKNI
ncbi:2678_t:CDS:2, partial [Cetraspora pellucida]